MNSDIEIPDLSHEDSFDTVQLRRWQAAIIEKYHAPQVGEWNIPEMLRDDAAEIERLRKRVAELESRGEG